MPPPPVLFFLLTEDSYVLVDVIKEDPGSCDAVLTYIAEVTRERGIAEVRSLLDDHDLNNTADCSGHYCSGWHSSTAGKLGLDAQYWYDLAYINLVVVS